MWKRSLWIVALLLAPGVSTVPAGAVELAAMGGTGTGNTQVLLVEGRWVLDPGWRWLSASNLELSGALGGGRWKWNGTSSTDVYIAPVLRWRIEGDGLSPYVEGGVGAHLLSNIDAMPRLSTALEFGPFAGAGVTLGRWSIGYRFLHLSNAGIKQPNNGVNAHLLRIGREF